MLQFFVVKVFIRRAEYTDPNLNNTVSEILGGALTGVSIKGKNVLVKPNLLAAFPPERAITTHPLIVKAVAEYILGQGGSVTISDSPGIGSIDKIINESGIKDALHGMPVTFKAFTRKRTVSVSSPFNKIEIASGALDADVIINLPKLKTHAQMLLTLGVKNLFGCIVGMQKPEWHFRTGVNRDRFAHLLLEIYKALRPSVTILDGILAMEGEGPGKRGSPRHVGMLFGSRDAIALDHVVADVLQVDQRSVPVNKIASDMGLLDSIVIDGEMAEVAGFIIPELENLVFGPPYLHSFMRKHLTRRPAEDRALCQMCLECITHCPVYAINEKHDALHFDYDKCIRCYCCIELCPHGAMKSTQPLVGRLLNRFIS